MDQDSAHMVAASKVPMLKLGEFELWRMRIKQYIQMIDYALWEVIKNGNTSPKITVVEGVEKVMPPTTSKDKLRIRYRVNAYNIDNLNDAIICAFLASQPNNPQLAHDQLTNPSNDYGRDGIEMAKWLFDYEGRKAIEEYSLDKFVNKHVVENKKSDEEVFKVVRKFDDSLIIEDWVSDSEEENVSQT
ncbi:hypothetical protein Tco_0764399 [Tanacetum coccineum]